MGNAIFIVWRESVEAMLVLGILYAWLQRSGDRNGQRALWAGVAAGAALAAGLGWAMLSVQGELSGAALEAFQGSILVVAAVLIVQMVLWMQRHGRDMRQRLESELARASGSSGGLGIATVAALAIGREGAETAIFLYGIGLDGRTDSVIAGGVIGFGLAGLTAWSVNRGLRLLNYRLFFRVTGSVLLLFAAALMVGAIERGIGAGWLPPLLDPVWDSSAMLDDSTGPGAIFAAFTGYRARPSLLLLMLYGLYWLGIAVLQRRNARHG